LNRFTRICLGLVVAPIAATAGAVVLAEILFGRLTVSFVAWVLTIAFVVEIAVGIPAYFLRPWRVNSIARFSLLGTAVGILLAAIFALLFGLPQFMVLSVCGSVLGGVTFGLLNSR
jgi:hypothetical protein